MTKRVCPVCEHVDTLRAEFTVQFTDGPESVPAWACPECPFVFVAVDHLAQILAALAATVGSAAPTMTTTLQEQPDATRIQPALR